LSPVFSGEDNEITLGDMDVLWKEIVEDSNDELFGLHFGESMQLTALGIIGQIITTSNTVGDALNKASSMVSLIAEGFEIHSEILDDEVEITLLCKSEISTLYPSYHKNMMDFLGALTIHELDGLILNKIGSTKRGVPYSTESLDEYCRVLRCKDYEYSGNVVITIDKKLLGIPVISANYRMQQYLESLLKDDRLFISNKVDDSLKHRVSTYIMNNSYLKILSIDDVAANFNLSSRTLQRKLREEGSSFKEIVDKVRKELALQYLKDKNNQIKDVAYSLGYNESSAFVRAFKRWTGTTPSLYNASW
jgi:AraC-like DNA-binding protein